MQIPALALLLMFVMLLGWKSRHALCNESEEAALNQ